MQYKPLHCWDCGDRVIAGDVGQHIALPNLRQVKFGLDDGSYCESTFCQACADRPWSRERAKAFEAAVNAVTPLHHIAVIAVEGVSILQDPIMGIVEK